MKRVDDGVGLICGFVDAALQVFVEDEVKIQLKLSGEIVRNTMKLDGLYLTSRH